MGGYTDAVGGTPIGVSSGNYAAFSPNANVVLQWPQYAVLEQPFARLMDVSPTVQGLTVQMPDATLSGAGEACIINNKGAFAFNLLDGGGNVLAAIQPSEVRYSYLMDNSSAAGLWSMVLFGKSNSSQDASQFVGPGLKAINNTLAWAPATTLIGGTAVLDTTSRAKVVVWTGGSGSLTLPDLALVGNDFVFEFRNQGSGVATLTPAAAQTIDGSSTAPFNLNESCLIHASSTGWLTVGRGRSTQFAFSQLVKNIAGGGGSTTLSLTEASAVVQNYIGALSGTETVNFPSVVQVYYVSNQTTGGNSIIFKNVAVGGTSVSLAPGQNAILFSDGTNVINANTTTTGLSSLILGAGSAGSPVVSIGTASNGFYAPGTNQVGLALNGVGVVTWTANGTTITAPSAAMSLVSPSGPVTLILDRVSGQTGSTRYRTSGVDRFSWDVSNEAESGADVGSDLFLNSYNDAGVVGSVLAVNRSLRTVFFTFLPVAAGSSVVTQSAAQPLTNKTIDGSANTLRNINLSTQVVGILSVANGGTGNQSGSGAGPAVINLASTQATGILPISKGGTGSSTGPDTVRMMRAVSASFVSGQRVSVGNPSLFFCDAAGNMGPFPIATSGNWVALSFIGAGVAGLWVSVP